MSRNAKIIAGVIAAVVVVAGVVVWATSGSSSTKKNEVVIFSRVQRRTLQDTVSLNGTLARKQIRNITASTQGLVNKVYSSNGSTARAGDPMFAVNGRRAIAETGTVAFFRSLVPGDQGDDVTQLKQILTAAGDYPGPMNNQFTQQTQFALAQWQAQNHYPNSTPANPESVTVSLEQGTGYKLGSQASAGLVIGPPPAQTTGLTRSGAAHAVLVDAAPAGPPPPVLTIQSVDSVVPQGAAATFVIEASAASGSDISVSLSSGGTAGSGDVVTPPSSVTLPAGATSTSVAVQTRANNLVEAEPTLILSLAAGSGYSIGSPSSAQTTITNNNVPALQITGSSTVSSGGSATLTVTANQAPLQNIQVGLQVSGSAQQGTDYQPVNPVLVLNAGSTTASVTVTTLKTTTIEPTKYIVVSLAPSPTSYSIGAQGSAVVTISGSSAPPTATLTSATTYLQKGEPYQVTISLSQATSSPLPIVLSYGGTAVQGTDYTVPGGTLTVPAGQTSLPVTIPTVTDNLVEANRVLTVSISPGAGYQVGSPSSASVTINSTVVPTLTITSNTPTVTQGGAASFTITADQAPVKDTSVNFAAQGTAQPGQNYVPLPGTALLKAGQTQVTVVLQSIQSNVTFDPTDMIVGQWPTRIGQVFVKAGAPVTPGEPILSLTEPNLSVTLQATAADRSKLRVGQRATVQIAGENNVAAGTVTELDATPTTVSSGSGQSQVYEGRIEVSGLLGADGSQVSITVIDQEETDALTVPIAAVKQNGSGISVVRVINLATGRITEVPVTTGLTEGSYVQITRGLRAGQIVVVEVDQPS